jgi:aspartyl-tRNA(Asn)/glutamyl-tRNA(Gln) amidotransferase subunit A
MHYVRNTLEKGKNISADEYLRALTKLYEFRDKIEQIFEKYDFISTPTMAIPAFECNKRPFFEKQKIKFKDLDDEHYDYSNWNFQLTQFTALFNWSGNPAAALPCGFSSSGLPVSLQIVGKKEDEIGVLQASRAFEKIKPWHDIHPDI